jgi:zinc transport system ATP-binding protein
MAADGAPSPVAAGAAPLLEARGLGLAREGVRILWDVTLRLVQGEIVTVVGPNGSGKTSLLRLLIGAERPTEGRIARRPGLRIGYVPQRMAVDYTMPLTVGRFLALSGGRGAGAALERVGVADLAGRQMRALSGGQFQRVLLAQALMRAPDLLVLDEAAQGLDQPGVARFYRLVEELRAELGCAVLMVGHDLHVVMAASDRVICLNGHICCEGSPVVVSAAPAYRALFGFGTEGALALYRHEHDHAHAHDGERRPHQLEDGAGGGAGG